MSGTLRTLALLKSRVETGPLQFGDDWPGLFIRGDECAAIAQWLKNPEEAAMLGGDKSKYLIELLESVIEEKI